MGKIIPKDAIKQQKNKDKNVDWSVKSNTSTYNLSSIKELIKKGEDGIAGGIKLKPFYQRDYKFNEQDESLLIESILLGIPIPTIYTASNSRSNIHYFNVIDGQHRLRAVYRFLCGKYRLKGLEKLEQYNNLKFEDLPTEIKNELNFQKTLVIENIHVQNNPALEWEIFKRYNKGGNPLTGQEMRGIVFASEFDAWVQKYWEEIKNDTLVKNVMNISNNRFQNKTIHEEFYVFLSIYEYGIIDEFYSSTNYADKFMEEVSMLDYATSTSIINIAKSTFEGFLNFLDHVYCKRGIEYPLSKEIYKKVDKKSYKCQVSILMILTVVYKFIVELGVDYKNEELSDIIYQSIKKGFLEGEFEKTNASTTRPSIIRSTSDLINGDIGNRISQL
nr:DUF262 domain-containing protein [uncultured Cellulosilyticum sp.]